VISRRHPHFKRDFARLPKQVQQQAREAYRRFKCDPQHPGIEFKKLHTAQPLWSVRINDSYRAVGVRDGEKVIWFFIGTHAQYDQILRNL